MYDYVNRAQVVRDLMEKGCGKNLTRAIAKMFTTSTYFPKLDGYNIGEGIDTQHGVTQGRRSSGNLFSFYISDMKTATQNLQTNDFMDPINLAQLADDTASLAEQISSMALKLLNLFGYSSKKYQHPNIKKTLYCHFSKNPSTEPIKIDEQRSINSIDFEKGYKYNC